MGLLGRLLGYDRRWPDISIKPLWENYIKVEIEDIGRFPQCLPLWWETICVDNYQHPEACARAVETAANRLQKQADTWRAEAAEYKAKQRVQSEKVNRTLRRVEERSITESP